MQTGGHCPLLYAERIRVITLIREDQTPGLSLQSSNCSVVYCSKIKLQAGGVQHTAVRAISIYTGLCADSQFRHLAAALQEGTGLGLGWAGLGWAGLAESVFWKSEIVHHSSCPLSTAELSCSCFCSGSGDKICAEIGGDKQQHISFAGKCCACAQFSELKPIKFLNFGINIVVR